jgi:hypothetical protein
VIEPPALRGREVAVFPERGAGAEPERDGAIESAGRAGPKTDVNGAVLGETEMGDASAGRGTPGRLIAWVALPGPVGPSTNNGDDGLSCRATSANATTKVLVTAASPVPAKNVNPLLAGPAALI